MRYWIPTTLTALAGGFVFAESQIFSASTASDLSFAVGIAITAFALAAALGSVSRGRLYTGLALLTAVIGAWITVESLVFSDALAKWLSFGSGAGVLGLSLISLAAHERSGEGVVHPLEESPAKRERVKAAA